MTIAVRQGTDAWLEERRRGIGSSDIPVIAGESPYRSAYSLWAEKAGVVTPEEPDADQAELFAIGHLMEPVLLEIYERRTGRHPKRAPQMRVHPDLPWARASLDATAPVRRIVEAKWTNASRWGDAGIPDDVLLQVQWALFVTGWDVADVVALVGRSPRVVEVGRDQALINELVATASDFWRCVETKTPWHLDGSDATRRALASQYPADNGQLLPATDDVAELVAALRAAKEATAAAEAHEATIANALRAVIGEAAGVEGLVTYRKNADSARVAWPAVAAAYRSLLTDHSSDELKRIVAEHTTSVEGPRVLRLAKEKE